MNRTDRLLGIVLELQAHGWQRAEDLARTFEVSKRTIYRDMLALMESGVPVMSSPGQGYALVEGYFLPPLSFSADEAVTLLLGADYITRSLDAQFQAAARSAGSKILAVLSDERRTQVRNLQSRMLFVAMNPLEGDTRPELLWQLRRAILQQVAVHLDYHGRGGSEASGEKTARRVDPYALINVHQTWYLVGYCHLRRDVRNFRLDRIDHLQILKDTFILPADFHVQAENGDERRVVVRVVFDPAVSRWVMEDRNYYQVAAEKRSDGLLVSLLVRQETDVLQWLLGWGGHVRVLEPVSLRDRIRAEAEIVLRAYATEQKV
ncbi:MAG: YafY family transcriptional regulator [Anaerolineae bacterium]|nr:YafY family transcriptional regulator [Anaerolineae bacterium]